MMGLSNAFYGGGVMDTNKYGYVLIVIFMSFAFSVDATMYAPKLPLSISQWAARKQKKIQNIQKKLKEDEYYICDKNGDGIIVTADLLDKMKTLRDIAARTKIIEINLFSEKTIKNFLNILSTYEHNSGFAADNIRLLRAEGLDLLLEFIKIVDFVGLGEQTTNVFLDISTEQAHKKIKDLLDANSFEELYAIAPKFNGFSPALVEKIYSYEWLNEAMQNCKKRVKQYCLNFGFGDKLRSYGYNEGVENVKNISVNGDGSRLFYTQLASEKRDNYSQTYVIDLINKSVPERINEVAFLHSLWINNDTIAWVKEAGYEYYLQVFNCLFKKIESRQLFAGEYKDNVRVFMQFVKSLNHDNIVYLFASKQYEYVLGIFNFMSERILYKKLTFGKYIKLIHSSDEYILFLDYDKDTQEMFIYRLSAEYNYSRDPYLVKELIVPGKMEKEFNIFVSSDGSTMAFIVENKILIQSLAISQNAPIVCSVNDVNILSLAISQDNKILMTGCDNGKIVAFDIQTGERMGELLAQDSRAFGQNYSVAFSEDGSIFAIGGENRLDLNRLFVMKVNADWQKKRDTYFRDIDDIKEESFDKIILLKSLDKKSNKGKKPVELTEAEKNIFNGFNLSTQQMFFDINYVSYASPVQQASISQPVPPTQSIESSESPKANFLQQAKDIALYYWQRLRGIQPSSSDTKKSKAMQDFDKLMGDKNRYVNE